jgi:hypothetical protein
MSSRRFLALPIALAMMVPGVALAQSTSPAVDSALGEIRMLDSVMLVRARAVDSVRRSLVRSAPPVEVVRGPLRVRTDSVLAPRVRLAVQSLGIDIDRRRSEVVAERVSTRVPTVTRDSARSLFGLTPTISFNADTTGRWSMIGQRQVASTASAARIADALGTIVEQIAMQGADSALAAWVMLGRVPLRSARDTEAVDAYVELVTTESIVLRRCRARDIAACLDALGLDSVPEHRLARWYAPQDYRSAVRVAAPDRGDSVAVSAWLRCRETADDSACRTAASALPDARVPLPLSAAVRFTFLREVLDTGGAGSFDRLVRTRGSIRDRLATAAGEPLDRTVRRWLDHVERSRPDPMPVPASMIVASLGWIGLVLALSLTGRNQWA